MDPDETLRTIRQLVKDIMRGEYPLHGMASKEGFAVMAEFTPSELAELGQELAEAVSDLDAWLSKKGFKPKDWA